jgi:hypothetical protein
VSSSNSKNLLDVADLTSGIALQPPDLSLRIMFRLITAMVLQRLTDGNSVSILFERLRPLSAAWFSIQCSRISSLLIAHRFVVERTAHC